MHLYPTFNSACPWRVRSAWHLGWSRETVPRSIRSTQMWEVSHLGRLMLLAYGSVPNILTLASEDGVSHELDGLRGCAIGTWESTSWEFDTVTFGLRSSP